MDLRTEKTLSPGAPGTKKWMREYGNRLFRVRYRYDRNRKIKLKTVELIAEEKPCPVRKKRPSWNRIVKLRVQYGEIPIARMVKESRGVWNRNDKLWFLPYDAFKSLSLTHRIMK